jgi:hypothetical protein
LSIILLTGEDWNPSKEVLWPSLLSREELKMRNIRSLLVRQVNSVIGVGTKAEVERYGETEMQLGKISNVYEEHEFCNQLISAINIATMYHDDVDRCEDEQKAQGVISNERHSRVTPEEVSRKWNIGLQMAKDTLKVTIRTALHPMTRRVRVKHLHLHHQRLQGMWYADTLLSKVKSKLGNTCANVYSQGKFTRVIPMTSRKDAGKSLIEAMDDVRVPERLITDGATEFTGTHTEFVKEA